MQISPPNQPHKQRCALEVLAGAVQRHSAELAALLEPPGRQLRFNLQTEDFGVTWRKVKSKLPAFSFCTGACVCVLVRDAWQRAAAVAAV